MISIRPVTPFPKITAPTATEVCSKFKPSPAAHALLKPTQTPAEYLNTLEQHKQSMDAVNVLSHGMPERESVWWACQSSRQVETKLNPADKSALSAAESWVKNPTAQTKAAAAAAASKTDYTGPGAWAAQAAAWSQPPNLNAVVPTLAAPAVPKVAAPAVPSMGAVAVPKLAAPAIAMPTMPALTAPAVSGSVLLAAGLVNRPAMSALPKPKLQVPTVAMPKLQAPTLSAPSLTPPQIPPVDLDKQADMLHPFINLGKDVASGKNSWV